MALTPAQRWAAERGTDEDRPTSPGSPEPTPGSTPPLPRPVAPPGPPDTIQHAEGCRRPAVTRTLVARNGTSSRWETKCSSCRRRTFEVVDAELERQQEAGLKPGDHWPAEVTPRAVPYVKRYFERPESSPPRTGHRVGGF